MHLISSIHFFALFDIIFTRCGHFSTVHVFSYLTPACCPSGYLLVEGVGVMLRADREQVILGTLVIIKLHIKSTQRELAFLLVVNHM